MAYTNPVYRAPAADPFVLKVAGTYWCYFTGLQPDGRALGLLRSPDLVRWEYVGSLIDRLGEAGLGVPDTCYWAPEVAWLDGRFYLYYSAGNEASMQLRVAVAGRPAGPFVDSGRRLTPEDFAIDAHVFTDRGGRRYLFYATDFLAHTHIGTGTVVDELLDPLTLAGRPQPVTRARFDWQVYDPARQEKGGVRWHTVEGPFVLSRKGRYYQMFSGGNWQNRTYGVSYAVSPTVLAEGEWQQAADGDRVPPILRSLPEAGVIGPGHNSVVRGPDNRQLFCIYHRWDATVDDRVLAIDRLDWLGPGLVVLGPTTTPQPAPNPPALAGAIALESAGHRAEHRVSLPAPDCLVEATFSAQPNAAEGDPASFVGVVLDAPGAPGVLRCLLDLAERELVLRAGSHEAAAPLPAGFDAAALHLLRLEVNARQASVALDGLDLGLPIVRLAAPPSALSLVARRATLNVPGLEVTAGWEDDFCQPAGLAGWNAEGGQWRLDPGQRADPPAAGPQAPTPELRQADAAAPLAVLARAWAQPAYELVVNARLLAPLPARPGAGYGIHPAFGGHANPGPLCALEPDGAGDWRLVWQPAGGQPGVYPLPAGFDPGAYQHYRFRVSPGALTLQWCDHVLATLPLASAAPPQGIALSTRHCAAAFDLVRVTALPSIG